MHLLLALLSVAAAGCASSPSLDATGEVSYSATKSDTTWTDAERTVHATVQGDGVHVVHFWAPWCGNSTNELAGGWYETIDAHPDVSFTFVTIWNDGELGERTLERFGIPKSVTLLSQPDRGPSADHDMRRKTFMDLPVTWTPTTWVFNRNGNLAFAANFGELTPDELDRAIRSAAASWEH